MHDLEILVSQPFRVEYFGKAEHLSIHSFCSRMLGAFSNFQLLKSCEKKRNIYALHDPKSLSDMIYSPVLYIFFDLRS